MSIVCHVQGCVFATERAWQHRPYSGKHRVQALIGWHRQASQGRHADICAPVRITTGQG